MTYLWEICKIEQAARVIEFVKNESSCGRLAVGRPKF